MSEEPRMIFDEENGVWCIELEEEFPGDFEHLHFEMYFDGHYKILKTLLKKLSGELG